MTYTEALAIAGITEANIINYFTTFNREEFDRTASLFAEDGELIAPFEKPIVGRKEIAAYLDREAKNMTAIPAKGSKDLESKSDSYKVIGKVKTSLFSVNVAWFFTLNPETQIAIAKIKLLASPQELLSLKSKRER